MMKSSDYIMQGPGLRIAAGQPAQASRAQPHRGFRLVAGGLSLRRAYHREHIRAHRPPAMRKRRLAMTVG